MSVIDVSLCVGQEQKDREAELYSPTDIPVDRNISFWIKFVELQVLCQSCDLQKQHPICCCDPRLFSCLVVTSVEDVDSETGILRAQIQLHPPGVDHYGYQHCILAAHFQQCNTHTITHTHTGTQTECTLSLVLCLRLRYT